jgi:GNAT superfamily N-acetyltransferase
MSYEFLPISTDNKAIKEIVGLMRIVFPKANKYSEAFIEWQYKNNPEGKVVGYNAYKNGVLVAHYALIPFKAFLFGKEEGGLLSLNTATHPEHQGKKLFSTLADKSYQLAIEQGYAFVIGVANANSTPGFVNKLGFQLVGALDAKLGFGKIRTSAKNSSIQFFKKWNKEALVWRMENPESKYRICDNTIYSATDKVGIKAALLNFSEGIALSNNNINIGFRPLSLWIGIDASINWAGSLYFNIPDSMRPSPLNFIFKDLTKENRKLEFKNVRFNAVDFDAY